MLPEQAVFMSYQTWALESELIWPPALPMASWGSLESHLMPLSVRFLISKSGMMLSFCI